MNFVCGKGNVRRRLVDLYLKKKPINVRRGDLYGRPPGVA